MCSGCHREEKPGFEHAHRVEDCADCHAGAPPVVFFLDGPKEVLLEVRGEEAARIRTGLVASLEKEELVVVREGAPRLRAECSFRTFEVRDDALVPPEAGMRLIGGEVRAQLTLGPEKVREYRARSRVEVTRDPSRARRTILDRLTTDTFRFLCATLEAED